MERGRRFVILALLTTVLVGPGLALGAVHPETLAIFLVLASALMLYISLNRRMGRIYLDLVSMLFLGLIAYTIFQMIPLPAVLVKLLSPMAHEVRSRALVPLGAEVPSFMPLTLDVTFTVVELGKLLLYIGVYWTCLLWTRKFGSKHVLTTVIAAGALAAAVLLVHRMLLAEKIYGFYTPSHLKFLGDRSTAPLINGNHMAALLGLCSAVAIGRAMMVRDRSQRILLVILAGIIGASLFLTLSRGGIAAFLCGQVVFVLLRVVHRARKERGDNSKIHLVWFPVGMAVSLGLALFVAQDAILGEFVDGDARKLELIGEGLPLIGDFFGTGVGRGAFWVGLPLVSDIGSKTTFTHAENAVIQILADYGLFVGLAALAVCVSFVVRLLLRPPSRPDHAAALSALVAFGLHNLVDFNMEIPGVAVLATALLGVLIGSRQNSRRSETKKGIEGFRITRPMLGGVAAFILLISGIIGIYFNGKTVTQEEAEYRHALANRDAQHFTGENLSDVLSRHPSSWYFPFIVGVWKYHVANENPMPWLGRALELNSASGSAHFYAGRTYLNVGKMDQALLEFRIAAKLNPALTEPVSKSLVNRIPRFAELSKIAVSKADKLLFWGSLATTLRAQGHEAESEAADLAVLQLHPTEPRSLARQAARLADRKQTDEAFVLAEKLGRIPGYGPAGAQVMARIFQQLGNYQAAVDVLQKEAQLSPKDVGLLRALAWARQRGGDFAGALKTASVIRTMSVGVRSQAQVTVLEAELSKAEGRTQSALANLRKAHALDPSNQSILLKIANLAEEIQDEKRLLEALKKLIAIDPTNQYFIDRLAKLKKTNVRRDLFGE